jgi:hypothetical protein
VPRALGIAPDQTADLDAANLEDAPDGGAGPRRGRKIRQQVPEAVRQQDLPVQPIAPAPGDAVRQAHRVPHRRSERP